jgi:hypothetical protein
MHEDSQISNIRPYTSSIKISPLPTKYVNDLENKHDIKKWRLLGNNDITFRIQWRSVKTYYCLDLENYKWSSHYVLPLMLAHRKTEIEQTKNQW